jgi:hypothetical protein
MRAVKLGGQFNHRRIAPRADIGDDRGHGLVDILGLFALQAQKGLKTEFKIRVLSG